MNFSLTFVPSKNNLQCLFTKPFEINLIFQLGWILILFTQIGAWKRKGKNVFNEICQKVSFWARKSHNKRKFASFISHGNNWISEYYFETWFSWAARGFFPITLLILWDSFNEVGKWNSQAFLRKAWSMFMLWEVSKVIHFVSIKISQLIVFSKSLNFPY